MFKNVEINQPFYLQKISDTIICLMDLSAVYKDTVKLWESISLVYSSVPKSLYRHQIDTISLLLNGRHVFCSSPTGSGKTLAQLATVLFTQGIYYFSILTCRRTI